MGCGAPASQRYQQAPATSETTPLKQVDSTTTENKDAVSEFLFEKKDAQNTVKVNGIKQKGAVTEILRAEDVDEPADEFDRQTSSMSQLTLGAPSNVNISEWICHTLVEAGVTHVYGGHGGALVPVVNAVVNNPSLTWVPVRDEQNASLMAAAHAKLTGSLACCVATSGPGATNLTTGLFDAAKDQCPVICITGLKPRAALGYSEFQDLPQSRIFDAGGLEFSQDCFSPEATVPLLRDAMTTAINCRTCVHLAIPVDVQAAPCPVPLAHGEDGRLRLNFPNLSEDLIEDVVHELHLDSGNICKAVIAVGHRSASSGPTILKLAERIHAPVFTRLDAKGCCDESHPLVWGVVGVHGKPGLEVSASLIEGAQLVLAFGVHDLTLLLCNRAGLQVRPLIQFESDAACVLSNARYKAAATVIGDIDTAIEGILEKCGPPTSMARITSEVSLQAKTRRRASMVQQWSEAKLTNQLDVTPIMEESTTGCRTSAILKRKSTEMLGVPMAQKSEEMWKYLHQGDWKHLKENKEYHRTGRFQVEQDASSKYPHPALILQEVSDRLGPEDVICVDTGDITLWASLCLCLKDGQRTLSSERLGTMGYSVNAGIVATLVRKEKGRAVALVGDGAFQMACNELGTVKQIFANAPKGQHKMLIVVFDNELWGRVIFGFDGAKGCDLGPSPDFVTLAKSYGGDGFRLEDISQLPTAMEKAFAADGLFLIHALIDPNVKADMSNFNDSSTKMMNSG